MGGLYHLLAVPQQRDDIMTRIKLMEGKLRKKQLGFLKDTDDLSMRFVMHACTLLFIFLWSQFLYVSLQVISIWHFVSSDQNNTIQPSFVSSHSIIFCFCIDCACRNMNLETSLFKRVLLETPSGFAIFDVREDVFTCPMVLAVHLICFLSVPFCDLAKVFPQFPFLQLMWLRFIDERDFLEVQKH